MKGDLKVGQFPCGPSLYRGLAAKRVGWTSHKCLPVFCKNILTLPEAQTFYCIHFAELFFPSLRICFHYFRTNPCRLPHRGSGPCLLRFRTCLYQTGAKLRIRGLGAYFSDEISGLWWFSTPIDLWRSESWRGLKAFLDGVVHTSLSTPAPKRS